MSDDKKHGRHCYQIGCECDERKIANAAYSREQRAAAKRRRADLAAAAPTKLRLVSVPASMSVPAADVPARPAPQGVTVESDRPLGRVGRSVVAELALMGDAAERYPALVALAVSLAGLIDGGDLDRTVQAAKEIKLLLAEMRPREAAKPAGLSAQDAFLERIAAPL